MKRAAREKKILSQFFPLLLLRYTYFTRKKGDEFFCYSLCILQSLYRIDLRIIFIRSSKVISLPVFFCIPLLIIIIIAIVIFHNICYCHLCVCTHITIYDDIMIEDSIQCVHGCKIVHITRYLEDFLGFSLENILLPET